MKTIEKKYTQEEFNDLPVANGIKICPSGDYSQISSFVEWCKFGENCKFGGWCSFEGAFTPKDSQKPYISINRIGDLNVNVYFYNFTAGFYVREGQFFGTEDEWVSKLKASSDANMTKNYSAALDLVKMIFGEIK